MRIDQFLVQKKLAPSRSKAQELIHLQQVEIFENAEWKTVKSSSQKVNESAQVRIKENSDLLKYVSRAGLKLEGAMKHFGTSVEGLRVLDIGQSTGGFTDCVLQHGAQKVIGLDVGHDQIHPKIKSDSRVVIFEGVHISKIEQFPKLIDELSLGIDLCVIDVSFISIEKVFAALALMKSLTSYQVLALIKPQFEVGRAHLDKKGVVKDREVVDFAKLNLKEKILEMGFVFDGEVASSIIGGDGNQEYFFKLSFQKQKL